MTKIGPTFGFHDLSFTSCIVLELYFLF